MKPIRMLPYLNNIAQVLYKSEYNCTKYDPELRWFSDKLDAPADSWDHFHSLVIDYYTSVIDFKQF